MEVVKKQVEVYVVNGKEFIDKLEAEKYEKELHKELEYVFFTIRHNPDLTEGRGFYNTSVVAVPKNYAEHATALKYCFDTFGSPLAFVMGSSPIPNWTIVKSEKFDNFDNLVAFKEEKVSNGIGDYVKRVPKEIIYLKSNGEIVD